MDAMHIALFRAHPGKDRLIRTGHPWVFSGAAAPCGTIPAPDGITPLPSLARIEDASGAFLAWAQVNPGSKIRMRLLSCPESNVPGKDWLSRRLESALDLRRHLLPVTDAFRLVFGEADGIPGVVADRFGSVVVVQLETAGADAWRPILKELLPPLLAECFPGITCVLEASDSDGRRLEGLPEHRETWQGTLPEGTVEVREGGVTMEVLPGSQKTGFYADQRDNRMACASFARNRDVLDVCCYTGGFSTHAARAGARSITLVDASRDALELAVRNVARAASPGHAPAVPAPETRCGDAWQVLRELRKETRRFGLVILDPPKLAPTRQSLEKALRAYKDLNLQGMQLVEAGGLLASFSCSGLVDTETLQTTLAWAAKDCGLRFQIIARLDQGMDHPVPLHFPESRYLKGLLLRRMD